MAETHLTPRHIPDRLEGRGARLLKSWESLLLVVACLIFLGNSLASPYFLDPWNLSDATFNFTEKAMIAFAMALVIISGEIDLSVGAVLILDNGRKETFASPFLIPSAALCDPELTLGLPSQLTAATGMDAMTHCIEAVLSSLVHPPAEAIGIDGAERIGVWLERAVADGSDREARWHMMMGSYEGALAFVALYFLLSGGVGFLLSAITRYDWLALGVLWALAQLLRPLVRSGEGWHTRVLDVVLPPLHLLPAIGTALVSAHRVP